mgnify:CR=1 FL=1
MEPEQIKLVQDSWEKVLPISDKAAELFYGKLFEMDTSTQALFEIDTEEQGRKFMNMINLAVHGPTKLDVLVPVLKELGLRHNNYGVQDEQYDTVGGALLRALETGLGEAFTCEVKAAWTEAYLLISGVMKEAAASANSETANLEA